MGKIINKIYASREELQHHNTEFEQAVALANRVLDKPYIDPDGDICLLARQFLCLAEGRKIYSQQYVRVPMEPTKAMTDAGILQCRTEDHLEIEVENIWHAMISAAQIDKVGE